MASSDLPSPSDPTTSVEFAAAARALAQAGREFGLVGPSFRCPPKVVGVDRALRRRRGRGGSAGRDGADAVVSIRLRGRPFVAVLADMIEGVVAAHRLKSPHADRVRAGLWEACGFGTDSADRTEDDVERELDRAVPRVA